jgi:diguanylate cyclase (GGDEF)-like protein/PAS domain S-box-containing protein
MNRSCLPNFPDSTMHERPVIHNEAIRLMDAAGVAVVFVDANMRVTHFTDHAAIIPNLIWLDAGRPLGHVFANLLGCEELLITTQCVLDHPASQTVQLLTPAGSWMDATIRPWHGEGVDSTGAVINLVNVTEVNRLTQALREAQARYHALVEWSLEANHILRDGHFVYLNPAAVQLYGANSAQDMLGQSSQDRVHPDDLPAALQRMSALLVQRENAPMAEMRFIKVDGTVIDVQAQATLTDFEGAPAVQVAWRDITAQKRTTLLQQESQARMQVADHVLQIAFLDMLTGLPNRRVLVDRVNQTRLSSKRTGLHAALLLLDLDNFKPLNDTHGHAAGDLLLIEVARRLQECVRETDVVVRFGGDEFVVLLTDLSRDQAEASELAGGVARKIAGALKQPYSLEVKDEVQQRSTVEHHCTASIGIALFVNDDACHDEILKWADAAMYRAKKAGKDQIQLHDSAAAFNNQNGNDAI